MQRPQREAPRYSQLTRIATNEQLSGNQQFEATASRSTSTAAAVNVWLPAHRSESMERVANRFQLNTH